MGAIVTEVWEELGNPSATLVYRELKGRGYQIKQQQVKDILQTKAPQQIFRARPQFKGKTVSSGVNQAWQLDLMDYSKAKVSANEGHKYVLAAADTFTKNMYTVPLNDKTPASTAKAFN